MDGADLDVSTEALSSLLEMDETQRRLIDEYGEAMKAVIMLRTVHNVHGRQHEDVQDRVRPGNAKIGEGSGLHKTEDEDCAAPVEDHPSPKMLGAGIVMRPRHDSTTPVGSINPENMPMVRKRPADVNTTTNPYKGRTLAGLARASTSTSKLPVMKRRAGQEIGEEQNNNVEDRTMSNGSRKKQQIGSTSRERL